MNIIKLSGILLIELILEGTVFPFFNLNGSYPDLVLISLICFSMLVGRQQSYILGFIIGLLCDILYGEYIGLYALSFMITAFTVSIMSEKMFKNSLLAPISVFPIGVIINHTIIFVVSFLVGNRMDIIDYVKQFNVTYWGLNFIALVLIYWLTLQGFRNDYLRHN